MNKILLIGIGGTYNYGCEAIVRGTVKSLKNKNPDCEIFYASYNVEDDRKRLQGCDVKIIPRPLKKWTIKNIIKKIVGFFNVKIKYCYDSVSLLKDIDEVYSIGGDIYTLNSNNNYSESLPLFGDKCIRKGKKYYLWGCSVGPFTKNKEAESFFKKYLKNVTKIYARESNTVEYLKTIGIESNVELIEDPAFIVASEIKKESSQINSMNVVGLNLSPLSANHFYSSLEDALKKQIQTIKDIIDFYDCRIVLIPHVISNNINDDDFRYLKSIYERLPGQYQPKVKLIENDPGFIGIKHEIMKCDVVIAARMHCAINAVATNVPVILLSYSSKAKGMCKYVYGNDQFVMDLSQFKIENISKKITLLKTYLVENETIRSSGYYQN